MHKEYILKLLKIIQTIVDAKYYTLLVHTCYVPVCQSVRSLSDYSICLALLPLHTKPSMHAYSFMLLNVHALVFPCVCVCGTMS